MIEYTYLPAARWLLGTGLLLGLLVFASYWGARGRSNRRLRIALATLRWSIMLGLVWCLLDPEWVEAIKHQQQARVAVVLDTSRSMGIKDLPQERLAAAQAWLQQDFTPATPPDFKTEFYTFDDSLRPSSNVRAAQASGEATGLADALESVLSIPREDQLTGVVLCSDGIENVGKDPAAVAKVYRRKGIPIHTITLGTTNDMHDIIVENVQVRRVVPNQAPTKVLVSLRGPGFGQQTVPVQVLHEDKLVAVQDIQLTGGPQQVELNFTPRVKGFQVYEVRVPAQKGEWLTTNNRRLFGLEIIDPTIRVIYMEGTPQQPNSPIPEWKYLKSALESDPNIQVKTLYREFSAKGKKLNTVDADPETGEKIYPVEHPTEGYPRTMARLNEYDVIIHSDIRKESFTAQQLQNTARLVEEFGGGFVMIGGNSAFGKGGYHQTVLDRIIPAAMRSDNDSQARPFHLHVPPTAWLHPIVALGRTREESELIWTKKFPLLYGCNQVERAKPGAIVLGDDPAAPDGYGAQLVLAVQTIGRGRSMAFTSDTTRTWGKDFETLWGEKINGALPLTEANCDSRYYRQFWVNAVRWLAAGRISRTNHAVSLELAQSYCLPNEKVRASIKVRDKDLREMSSAEVKILVSNGTQTNTMTQAAFDSATHSYSADVLLPESGNFVISAVASISGRSLGDDRQLLVCEAADRELRDLRARPEVMADIARLSGGKALSAADHDPGLLRSIFYKAPPVTVEYRKNPAWDRTWVLVAALGLLSIEWAARRLSGMA